MCSVCAGLKEKSVLVADRSPVDKRVRHRKFVGQDLTENPRVTVGSIPKCIQACHTNMNCLDLVN